MDPAEHTFFNSNIADKAEIRIPGYLRRNLHLQDILFSYKNPTEKSAVQACISRYKFSAVNEKMKQISGHLTK
jgi:hypothetical protein